MKVAFLLMGLSVLLGLTRANAADDIGARHDKFADDSVYFDFDKPIIFQAPLKTSITESRKMFDLIQAASSTSHCHPKLTDDPTFKAAVGVGFKVSRVEVIEAAQGPKDRMVNAYFFGFTSSDLKQGRGYASAICDDLNSPQPEDYRK